MPPQLPHSPTSLPEASLLREGRAVGTVGQGADGTGGNWRGPEGRDLSLGRRVKSSPKMPREESGLCSQSQYRRGNSGGGGAWPEGRGQDPGR